MNKSLAKEIACWAAFALSVMFLIECLLHWIGPFDDMFPKKWNETESEYVLVEFIHRGTRYTCKPMEEEIN